MKANQPHLLAALLLSSILFSCFGCSGKVQNSPSALELNHAEGEMEIAEQNDSSCSYFYFLWGTHAENNQRFQEAEEAYEKALICDPDSRFILRKLPILLIRMNKPHAAAQRLRENIKRYPDEIQDRLLLARLDVRSGEIEEAIELYREVIELSPGDETSLLRLGFLYSQHNQVLEAKNMFQQALDLNPQSLFAHLYLARLAAQTGDMNEAGSWYQAALDLNWSIDLALEVAGFHGSREEYEKVEQQYRAILQQDPDNTRAALGLVHTLLLQNKETEALDELQLLRKHSSDPKQIDITIARLYLRSGKPEKAAAVLEPIILRNNDPEAIYMLAVIRYQEKDLARAMALLKTITHHSSHYEDSVYLRVRILLDQERDNEGMALLKEILEGETASDPGLYSLLASLYMERNLLKECYDILDRALKEYPDNPALHFEYGLLLEQDNRQEKAIVHMQKVLELEPNHAEALNYIGYTWADQNTNLEQALEYIEKAMSLKPGNGYIQDSLGWVYFRLGKLDRAKAEILKALDMEPTDPHIHDHLGDIYRAQGRMGKAGEAYKQAEELFSDPARKKRMRKKLNDLQ